MDVSGLKAMIRNRWNRENIYCTPDYWNAKAGEYKDTAVSGWPNRTLNEYYDDRELQILESCFPQLEQIDVLDVGCGTGRIARYLAGRGANVVGIDFSANAIELANQKSRAGNPVYRVQTVFELDEPQRFDIVLSLGCLCVACRNREQLAAALTRAFHSLKPGGKLLVLEPLHRGPLHLVLDMNVREFQEVMAETGFAVEEVRALHFWPIVRILGHFDLPRVLTRASYRLGEWALALTLGTYFGDFKAILASRPAK